MGSLRLWAAIVLAAAPAVDARSPVDAPVKAVGQASTDRPQTPSCPNGMVLVPSAAAGTLAATAAFCIDVLETTDGAYRECVRADRCTKLKGPPWKKERTYFRTWTDQPYPPGKNPLYPVTVASLRQAMNYCAFRGKRLPTSLEWKHASGLSEGFLQPWGNGGPGWSATDVCWGLGHPCEVGTSARDVSPHGVRDMAGNAQEWTFDPDHPTAALVGGTGWQFNIARSTGVAETINDRSGIRCAQNVAGGAQ